MEPLWNWLSALFTRITDVEGVANMLAGFLILIVGYIVALIVAGIVRRLLRRTDIDNRLARLAGADESVQVEGLLSRVVFYLLMLIVLVVFFTRINLGSAAAPLQDILNGITSFIPNLLAAAVLSLVAWLLATLVRMLVNGALRAVKLDERLNKAGALEHESATTVSQTIANVVFYLILFLFLPAILNALSMQGLLAPVQEMFSAVLRYVPNVFGALIIFVVGYFVARIVRQILTNLLQAAGADAFGARIGLVGNTTVSQLVGTIVYTLILLPVVIQALDTLNIAAISGPATGMLAAILNSIPAIFGAAIVIALSYFVARLVSRLVADLLKGVGVNRLPALLGLQMSGERQLSDLIGYLILVVVMLFASVEAANLLGFESIALIVDNFIQFGGQVLLGIIILAIGLYFANMVHRLVLDTGQSPFLATIARVAILILAGAMGVRQMGLAEDIVNLAFGIMLGAIGVAAAIAFGLGSRELAGREVERMLHNLRSSQQGQIEE